MGLRNVLYDDGRTTATCIAAKKEEVLLGIRIYLSEELEEVDGILTPISSRRYDWGPELRPYNSPNISYLYQDLDRVDLTDLTQWNASAYSGHKSRVDLEGSADIENLEEEAKGFVVQSAELMVHLGMDDNYLREMVPALWRGVKEIKYDLHEPPFTLQTSWEVDRHIFDRPIGTEINNYLEKLLRQRREEA